MQPRGAAREHFVYNRRSPSSFRALLASLGNFDDSLSAICTLGDFHMRPPQSGMFTEPTTGTQRLPSGQHCGARNA